MERNMYIKTTGADELAEVLDTLASRGVGRSQLLESSSPDLPEHTWTRGTTLWIRLHPRVTKVRTVEHTVSYPEYPVVTAQVFLYDILADNEY